MYTIELSDEARADYENAVAWYEEQKAGLGFDFSVRLAEIFESIEHSLEDKDFSTTIAALRSSNNFPTKFILWWTKPTCVLSSLPFCTKNATRRFGKNEAISWISGRCNLDLLLNVQRQREAAMRFWACRRFFGKLNFSTKE